jgi:hypothetical protein
MNFWIKNTKGEKSASLTLVVITFCVIILHMLLSIVATPIFGIAIAPFQAAESMLVLTPLLGLYWGRRNTDLKEKEIVLKHGAQSDME